AARMGGSAAPSTSPDLMRMLQDMERRIATLEARLDESNEAREKLERQVAAQSEELRVQRAAIARTQRALRTMTRGEEDRATEPALRDGETQAKTRVTPYAFACATAPSAPANCPSGRKGGDRPIIAPTAPRMAVSAGLARSVEPPNAMKSRPARAARPAQISPTFSPTIPMIAWARSDAAAGAAP